MAGGNEGHALYYNDDLITNLQLRWGEGFMSPGGGDELARDEYERLSGPLYAT